MIVFQTMHDSVEVEQKFILEHFMPFPQNTLCMVSAKGGIGKTNLSIKLSAEYVIHHQGSVALWLTEDDAGNVKNRSETLKTFDIIQPYNEKRVLLITSDPIHFAQSNHNNFEFDNTKLEELKKWCCINDVRLLVIDPLLAFFSGNENDNSQARVFMQPFINWCKEVDITIIIIHHASKTDGNTRGAGAFVDAVRCCYNISIPLRETKSEKGIRIEEDEDKKQMGIRAVTCTKDNRGATPYLYKLYGNDYFETTIIPKINIGKIKQNLIPIKCETIKYQEDEDKINDFFTL
jgi:replicative DNA helicase